MSTIAKDDTKKRKKPKASDISEKRLWEKEDFGHSSHSIYSQDGIGRTHFELAGNIYGLLEKFDVAVAVVEREYGVDFDELIEECIRTASETDDLYMKVMDEFGLILKKQTGRLDFWRLIDAFDLYNCAGNVRRYIENEDAESAAYQAALAVQSAIRLKGRAAEALLASGYKHSVVAPSKKTAWHKDLVKAAERLRKNGTRDKKIVGKLLAQFPDRSRSTIYRILKGNGFFK